jgi:FAD/FMN-containing dehydrogenase
VTKVSTWVNDVHSELNRTRVRELFRPGSVEEIAQLIRRARLERVSISIAGGRHAMGGQQFCAGGFLVDMTGMNRALDLDKNVGRLTVEAGIQWPALIHYLAANQQSEPLQWGIIQKQTGTDRLTIGGTLSANSHGRGLKLGPFIQQVESFSLVNESGELVECSREKNRELFCLAVGGYGLFGVIVRTTLRLAPRQKLERVVEVIDLSESIQAFELRIAEGSLYGDFQFATDSVSDDFLMRGVFSTYRPTDKDPLPRQRDLSEDDWRKLIYLGHTNKAEAFRLYATYYLATSGQVYWSDTHQLSTYLDGYHRELDQKMRRAVPASEVITELYIPRESLVAFMEEARRDFRENGVDVIYGTIRVIERDEESYLAWAKKAYACVVFNLHTTHSAAGVEATAQAFRRLNEMALRRGGSFSLTYHKFSSRDQMERAYPNFRRFLELKKKYDPHELFRSDWYEHYASLFAGAGD